MQKEWFEEWFDSPYYHILYKNRDEEEAGSFVRSCCRMLGTRPGETLLDLACGKGRHALAFAAEGLEVTGLDLSPESIAEASKHSKPGLRFFVHDMREPYCTSCFQYITNLFTSFGYFSSEEDHQKAAGAIATALQPSGIFLIDFVNRTHAIRNIEQNRDETKEIDGVQFHIRRSWTNTQFIKEIDVKDGDIKKTFRETVNSFTAGQMQALFESKGLTFLRAYGDYSLAAYTEDGSPRMILLFQKTA